MILVAFLLDYQIINETWPDCFSYMPQGQRSTVEPSINFASATNTAKQNSITDRTPYHTHFVSSNLTRHHIHHFDIPESTAKHPFNITIIAASNSEACLVAVPQSLPSQ